MSVEKQSRTSIVVSTIVRAAAMCLGALALGWGVTLTEGLGASVLGAIAGVIIGEVAARSRLKTGAIVGGALAVFALCWLTSKFATSFELLPSLLGPSGALTMAVLFRFGALIFTGTLLLRALAHRKQNLVVLELAALSAAVVAVFATHRDGVLVRPLWLSDWAWSVGLEPVQVLLAVGVGSVTMLALLLIVQNRGSRALSALVALVALGLLAIMTVNAVGLPAPTAENDLGLLTPPGEPPRQMPPGDGGANGGNGEDAGESDGGRGEDSGDQEGGAADAGEGDGGGADGGLEGGADGGGMEAGLDGGDGGSSSTDGGEDGGGSSADDGGDGGSASETDGESDAGSSGFEAGFEDVPVTPSSASSDGGGEGGGPPPPRPPSEDLENERQQQQQQRSAPMAVVLLDDDYNPPSQAFYLRQVALSHFNGTRLVPATRPEADRDIPQGYPTEPTFTAERPPTLGRTVVHHTVALITEHNNPFGIEGMYRLEPTRNPNPSRFTRAYRVDSLAQTIEYRRLFGRRVGHPQWTAELRQYYLQGPTDPRYRALADSIVNRIPVARRNDPFSRAVAIKLWLDDNLIYTTRARHASAADPTADMLWGNKRGYCVHFAHAAVFLWRSVGVPSRIGTGYHVDAQNRGSSSTVIVRSGDGHAWPEVYVEGVGWVVVDIAAKRNEDPPGQPQDEDERDRLGQMAREQPPDPQEPPRRQQQPQRNRAQEMARAAAAAFPWLLLLGLLALYGVKLWRRIVPSFAKGPALARVAYRAALDVLAEAGVVREYGETREAFSRRVEAEIPSLAVLGHEAERVKLSGPAPGEPDAAKLREALSGVRREVAATKKLWRRLLGLAHPTSFLDVD
ncbi:MAG: hypothetical protein JNK05_01050 [Myxococcales bacterium]|nr:hypothetical protein [Myxococcales bacterium]